MARIASILTATVLATTAAVAQTDWDMDADGTLSPQEFADGFVAAGTFGAFDADSSGQLDATEWEPALTEVGDYANMDLNGDGGVDEAEYTALLFNRYDADGSGTVDTAEMATIDADLATGGMLSP
ncbi:MAG: hypothetical protein AAF390_14525 [Pseudomonadota bacterium]